MYLPSLQKKALVGEGLQPLTDLSGSVVYDVCDWQAQNTVLLHFSLVNFPYSLDSWKATLRKATRLNTADITKYGNWEHFLIYNADLEVI